MPGNAGPVGDIAAISGTDKATVEMDVAHGLESGALVRVRQGAARLEGYIKADTQSDKRFQVYADQGLQQPAGLAAFAPGAKVELLKGDDWAIVAGINFYPGLRNLQGPVLDAAAFRAWAQDTGYVPDRQLLSVPAPQQPPDSPDNAQPSVDEFSRRFKTLIREAARKKDHYLGRRLYLFFSGHGIVAAKTEQPNFNEAMLLPATAEPMFLSIHVALRSWAEWFRGLGIFDEVFLIADCCRDMDDLVAPVPITVPGWRRERGEGRQFYVFSTKFDSKSWEQALGNPPRIRGVLSYVVTEALRNPKLYNNQKELTATALEAHIYKEVPNLSNKQEPVVEYPHKPGDELIIAKWVERKKQTVRITFVPPVQGVTADIFAGGAMQMPFDSHVVVDGQVWVQELDANLLYKVAIRDTARKCLFETTATDEVQDVSV